MYKFAREQKILEIGNVKVGGQIGENPTVIIPTIFYDGHNIVDEKNNTFDAAKAEALMNETESVCDETGNPCIFQVVGVTPEIMPKCLDFVAEHTDRPFIIDSAEIKARYAGLKHTTEVGYGDRVMYNAINMMIEEEEILALAEAEIEGIVILGFNMQDSSVHARIALLENGGGVVDKGLLEIAKDCGFEKILYDPGVQPVGQGAGASFRLLYVIKARYGLPTGIGAHNVPSSWAWLKKHPDAMVRHICDISANSIGITMGANSLFIGPIENAKYAAPAAAMADIVAADSVKDFGIEQPDVHPLTKLA